MSGAHPVAAREAATQIVASNDVQVLRVDEEHFEEMLTTLKVRYRSMFVV